DGTFSVVLTTGVLYEISDPEVFVRRGASPQKLKGSTYTIVVPEGVGAIKLEALQTVVVTRLCANGALARSIAERV
ncbi:MAG: hypothetical protein WBA46_09580, partial [Thermomicrobiales bacterium]